MHILPIIIIALLSARDPLQNDMCPINQDFCKLCQEVVEEAQAIVMSPQFDYIVKMLCNQYPEPTSKMCYLTIERIVEEFEKIEPEELCRFIKAC